MVIKPWQWLWAVSFCGCEYINRHTSWLGYTDCLSLTIMDTNSASSSSGSGSSLLEEKWYQCFKRLRLVAASTVAHIVATAAIIYTKPLYSKIPYHASALSGTDWVWTSQWPPRMFILRSNLAIFLYTCISSLSLYHVFKQFQCSCNTVSR